MSYSHEYYIRNREKILAATKRYVDRKRAENNEEWLKKQSAYMKEYYRSHPEQKEKKKEYDKNYYQTHKEYFKAKQKEYLAKKKEKAGGEKNEDKCSV